jgi:hypothetical protein
MSNPYAAHLGELDPLTVLAGTAAQLAAIDPARYNTPWAPGKWTYGQILAHLADCEVAFSFRLRQAIAVENYTVQPFDQDAWADTYPTVGPATALAVFTSVRAWTVAFLEALPPEAFDRPVFHPERGAITFRTLVEIIAGHDRNHLAQL